MVSNHHYSGSTAVQPRHTETVIGVQEKTMKRYTLLFTLMLSIGLMQFTSTPVYAGNDSQMGAASTPDQPTIQSSWGRLKTVYNGTSPVPYSTERAESTMAMRKSGVGQMALTSQSTGILWPFGPSESPSLWNGWSGTRTAGGYGTYCGSYRSTHSGADYYSRDLSRLDGSSKYKAVYGGRAAYVLRIRQGSNVDCYGNSVILWIPSENLQIRYSHLVFVNSWLTEGMYIPQGKLLGWVGNTGCGSFGSHLHLTAYKGIPPGSNGFPPAGYICMSDSYACQVYFYSGRVYP